MAPTIQRPGGPAGAHRQSRQTGEQDEKRSDLICRVKYCNTLPDIPFDPKFLAYPFDTQRFIAYTPTGLEKSYKYELLTEHDLGVTIDLINPDAYQANEYEKVANKVIDALSKTETGRNTGKMGVQKLATAFRAAEKGATSNKQSGLDVLVPRGPAWQRGCLCCHVPP